MALFNEKSKTLFNCTGGTTYDFDFKVFDEEALEVIRVDTEGVETILTSADYSVSNLTETGGRITTVATYSDGNLVVRRKQPKEQEVDYTQNDILSTTVLEKQLDKTVMMIQDLSEKVERCIQMPATTSEGEVPDYAELIDEAKVAAQGAANEAADSAEAAANSATLAQAQVDLATTQAGYAEDSAEAAAASALEAAEVVIGAIKATQEEAEAATDDLKYMTPLQVKNEVQKAGAVLIPAENVVLTGKEDVANKDTDGTLAANSDTRYPSQKAVKTYADSILQKVYPVGSIYTSTSSTNPATLFGFGTWESFGAGRVLVGLDASQTEFDTVEKTGGEKTHTLTIAEMPAHTHSLRFDMVTGGGVSPTAQAAATNPVNYNASSTGGGGAHNNLSPYIVVYFFRRTG